MPSRYLETIKFFRLKNDVIILCHNFQDCMGEEFGMFKVYLFKLKNILIF